MFVILSLVIAVAAFNIVSTLMMVVRDKRGDIAILRSFGTTPRSVVAIFASQGTLIGFVGTLLGVVLALLVSWQLGNIVAAAAELARNQSAVRGRVFPERPADAAAAVRDRRDRGSRARARRRRHVVSVVQRRAPAAGRGSAL